MRHSLSKDTAFNGETTPRHTFFVATRSVSPLAIPESCAQNIGLRLLSRHSYCEVSTVEACSLSLDKMSKSTEKVNKKYADTHKSIIVPLIKLSHHALVLPGRVQNRLRWWFALFLTLWCPLFIDNNLKTSCRSLMYWLCKGITVAFIWTHDIKLEIRATNKEATTLLYAMFVYNARREDWIQENDESVFENFRIRPENTLDTCGRKPYSQKKIVFPQTSGYVWTMP